MTTFRTAREHNATAAPAAPWARFNKWAKCVRAMATGVDAVTPAEAGRNIGALPEYRGKLPAGELAAIGEAVRGIELEMGRDVKPWSISRPWIAGKGLGR